MNHKKKLVLVIAAVYVSVSLLFSFRTSRAMTEKATTVPGNHPNIAITSRWRGADAGRQLQMNAVLALRNQSELRELKHELQKPGSANYHKWLSTAEFMRRFGPTQSQMDNVVTWLGASGFTVRETSIGTRSVRFSGSVADVAHVFSTRIVSNDTGYANVSDPQVPASLSGTIVAILGLTGPLRPGTRAIGDADVAAPEFLIDGTKHLSPQDFWTFYDEHTPTNAKNIGGTGPGDCIGLLESQSVDPRALKQFTKRFHLPPVNLTVTPTNPANEVPLATANEPYLDVDWAHAVAPKTPIVLYVTNDTAPSQFEALALAVYQNACGAISSSIHDFPMCPDFAQISAYADVEAQAVMQGQTYFHASGDFGSYFDCGQPTAMPGNTDVQPSIDESAASEDVTEVGGTQFDPSYDAKGRVTSTIGAGVEHVWNKWKNPTDPIPRPPQKGASTGGVSMVFPVPTWQDGIVPYGFPKGGVLTMRGAPDVSAVANTDEPGLWIVTTNAIQKQNGKGCGAPYCFTGEGGTSAGSPIWAGVSRLLAETLNTTRLGNINPRLYEMVAKGSAALVDVSEVGENCPYSQCDRFPGYQVGPGYDLGTGLGSPDINTLLADF